MKESRWEKGAHRGKVGTGSLTGQVTGRVGVTYDLLIGLWVEGGGGTSASSVQLWETLSIDSIGYDKRASCEGMVELNDQSGVHDEHRLISDRKRWGGIKNGGGDMM